MNIAISIFFLFILSGCTTMVGLHQSEIYKQIDFGPNVDINMCVYKQDEIDEEKVTSLFNAVNDEFSKYKITFKVIKIEKYERKSIFNEAIMLDILNSIPLEAPCDRSIVLIGRNFIDFVYGNLVGAEVLGAVDTLTHSRGYVVAQKASITQLLRGPEDTMVHETYHLFGCEHSLTLGQCYENIKTLKKFALESKDGFFPTYSISRDIMSNRNVVNLVTKQLLEVYLSNK